jgi:hypothetical protein
MTLFQVDSIVSISDLVISICQFSPSGNDPCYQMGAFFSTFSPSPQLAKGRICFYICARCVDPCEKYNGIQQACGHSHQIVETLFTLN